MYIVLLKFSENRDKEVDLMDGHIKWIKSGFDDQVFTLCGSLQPNLGGVIMAHNISLNDLKNRVNQDPFVANNVVTAEFLEVTPSIAEERLRFLIA